MNDLKTIRSAFGLTQEALAQLLDLGLPHLKLIEAGKRKLPIASLPFLECLLDEVKKLPPVPSIVEPVPDGAIAESLGLELKQTLRTLNKSLDDLQRKKAQMAALQEVSPVFTKQFSKSQFPSPSLRMEALGLKAGAWLKGDDAEQKTRLYLERIGIQAQLDWLGL